MVPLRYISCSVPRNGLPFVRPHTILGALPAKTQLYILYMFAARTMRSCSAVDVSDASLSLFLIQDCRRLSFSVVAVSPIVVSVELGKLSGRTICWVRSVHRILIRESIYYPSRFQRWNEVHDEPQLFERNRTIPIDSGVCICETAVHSVTNSCTHGPPGMRRSFVPWSTDGRWSSSA